ncbi:fibrinogen-like protein 1 [Osmerus mordax]|uniref:fibrinogen-like protein 1 n=1 Tax=Osmerus mordax TaxID=8014 RepID=UPI00350EC069
MSAGVYLQFPGKVRMGEARRVGDAGMAILVLLLLEQHLAAPVPDCGREVERLQDEIQGLEVALRHQQQYILELHTSQAWSLAHIPLSYLQGGRQYRDCTDVFDGSDAASGLYLVHPEGSPYAFHVYCDMNDGGGWNVFQRRNDGEESFDRAWVEYKHGFGDLYNPNGEFWLGNDALHYLTSQGNYDMKVDMEDREGNKHNVEFRNFRVDGEKDQYQLHMEEYARKTDEALAKAHHPPGQQWVSPDGVKFSTFDRTNLPEGEKCIHHDQSGWWFSRCESGNLNDHYLSGPYHALRDGVDWYTWHGWWYSLKSVVMMVRASDLQPTREGGQGPGENRPTV